MKVMFIEGTVNQTDAQYEKYINYLKNEEFKDLSVEIIFLYNYSAVYEPMVECNETSPNADENYPELYNVMNELYDFGIEISQLSCLTKDDYAVFLPGWSNNKYSKIKETICKEFNIPCIYIEETMRKDLLND